MFQWALSDIDVLLTEIPGAAASALAIPLSAEPHIQTNHDWPGSWYQQNGEPPPTPTPMPISVHPSPPPPAE